MQEARIEAVLQEMDIDLLVLARYMQIFSEDFCSRHAKHTINIHHSFLPAFEGVCSGPPHKVRMLGLMSEVQQRGGAVISNPLKLLLPYTLGLRLSCQDLGHQILSSDADSPCASQVQSHTTGRMRGE